MVYQALKKGIFALLVALGTFGFTQSAQAAPIVFDLGGVLIETNTMATFWHLGLKNIAHYALSGHNPFALDRVFLAYLDQILPRNDGEIEAHDDKGRLLPQYMCDWLKGSREPEDILDEVLDTIQEDPDLDSAEKMMFSRLAQVIFNPETFIATRKVVPGAISLIKELIAQGHTVYIISNWDAISFDILKTNHAHLFDLFEDRIVISGKINLIKPDPAIYRHLADIFDLEITECIFIDDQLINVQAAQSVGMQAIHCQKNISKLSHTKLVHSGIAVLTTLAQSMG